MKDKLLRYRAHGMYTIVTELGKIGFDFGSVDEAVEYAEGRFPTQHEWEVRDENDEVVYTHYTKVTNDYGVEIDFDAAVELMDDEIREKLNAEGIDNIQDFFDAYAEAHLEKFGEAWELDSPNPVW